MQRERHDVSDHEDRQVGWSVISALRREVQTTAIAFTPYFEHAVKNMPLATARAAPPPAILKRRFDRVFDNEGLFHDADMRLLPLFLKAETGGAKKLRSFATETRLVRV